MRAHVIRIGNSRGVRIPRALLQQCGLTDAVDLDVHDGRLIIRALRRARAGWADAFARMATRGDHALLHTDSQRATAWEEAEWRW